MGRPIDRSCRLFATTGPFGKAFPTLERAVVIFTEFDLSGKVREGTFDVPSEGGLMRCGNALCERGGYEVDLEIGRMIHDNCTEREVTMRCPGDEGTPKRHRGQNCLRSVKAKILLVYKRESKESRQNG